MTYRVPSIKESCMHLGFPTPSVWPGVHVAPNQKMCSITQAIESAREHFSVENGLDVPHYYLTPVFMENPIHPVRCRVAGCRW